MKGSDKSVMEGAGIIECTVDGLYDREYDGTEVVDGDIDCDGIDDGRNDLEGHR